MSLGGGPKFDSAIHWRHRRFTFRQCKQQHAPKVASDRIAAAQPPQIYVLRGGRDLVVFHGNAATGTVYKQFILLKNDAN